MPSDGQSEACPICGREINIVAVREHAEFHARSADRHKNRPVPFRPPEGDRVRLLALAERTRQPVNRILAEALAAYLDAAESAVRCRKR